MSAVVKLATEAELQLRARTLTGDVDHYPDVRAIVVMAEDGLVPTMVTVRAAEAPDEHALLAEDEAIVADWTDRRGAADALVALGLVERIREITVQVPGDGRLASLSFPQTGVVVRVL